MVINLKDKQTRSKRRNNLSIAHLLLSRRSSIFIYIYKVIRAINLENERSRNDRGSDEPMVCDRDRRAGQNWPTAIAIAVGGSISKILCPRN